MRYLFIYVCILTVKVHFRSAGMMSGSGLFSIVHVSVRSTVTESMKSECLVPLPSFLSMIFIGRCKLQNSK